MAYRLIIKFPFSSANDEQYVLALHVGPRGAFTNAKNAMDADTRCFKHIDGYTDSETGDWIDEYEGTLTGSVKAEDDTRSDMFEPLCPSKLKFNIACQQFPSWLMDLCDYTTNVRVVLYTDTGGVTNPLRVRWRGYLQCNTLNMTVVNDLLACPVVALDEIGVAKYMPFRANCAGRPAHLTLYQLFKKWWGMNWTDNFLMAYTDLGLATNQAALYWHRNASIIDDDSTEVTDLLNTLVMNLERYYLTREATWETVLGDVCRYLGVHFCIGGYYYNYSYDNYVIASYDSGTFTTYTYSFNTDTATGDSVVNYATLGNQQKMGADLQITYEPDQWKGVRVTSTPERPPIHKYLDHDNVKPVTPSAGHGDYVQVQLGQMGSGGKATDLNYWRLIYTRIVNAEDQWTEEADYIEMENCEVSDAGRQVGGDGYFTMTDAPLGHDRPNGTDTDSLEFVLEKNGMIPVQIGSFKIEDQSWRQMMVNYFMLLNNVWGRLYWDSDERVETDFSSPFKTATIKPFGLDTSVLPANTSYLSINFKAMVLNENIGKGDGIFETASYTGYTNLYGRDGAVFPVTRTYHNYAEEDEDITGRLEQGWEHDFVYWNAPFFNVRISIGNWFYVYDEVNHVWGWNYYADPSDAPTSKMSLVGSIDERWYPTGVAAPIIGNYYYSELEPRAHYFDTAFFVPLQGISSHSQPLEGNVHLEIWWPMPYLNAYLGNNQIVYNNNILAILINDIEIAFTDDAEIAGDDINVKATTETDPSSDTKELKEVNLTLSTPAVDGVFNNCLLYDGGKAWHNLQALHWQGGVAITPETYLSTQMSKVYNRPQMWVELQRKFNAASYGDIANMEFRVSGLTEAPQGTFVPVERKFDFTKGWVRWKLQQLDDGAAD